MGMYGEALNKLDDGLFVKISPGQPARLRLLAHPRIYQKAFTDNETGEVNIGTRFVWPVWDYDQERVRILEQGKSIFKGVAAAVENWDNGEAMPSPFDIKITRVGTSKNDTEYTVTPLPNLGTMPNVDAIQAPEGFQEKLIGTPLKDIIGGAKPEVIGLASKAGSLGLDAPRPTHADAAALESGDVVLKDLPDDDENKRAIDKFFKD